MPDLASLLGDIQRRISDGAYPNETAVRLQIVTPILNELGWDTDNPAKVRHEYTLNVGTKTRRIDIALCVSDANPRCIIELKSADHDLKEIGGSKGDQQLFE